ncbi:hypothetical protein N7492_005674 [Penicillium capsulatum]|uniref:Uncharacterized protein n=1 Tax=Penicillium capsulatum TaxID=69766 RepID=A0A9W9LRW3_9EURO|nr:hypothetical protein N7492_005674 [Penicillium capsulatum]KAJ6135229.1 hypothetical protein N7512_000389 [Penicillium capsulatum]
MPATVLRQPELREVDMEDVRGEAQHSPEEGPPLDSVLLYKKDAVVNMGTGSRDAWRLFFV